MYEMRDVSGPRRQEKKSDGEGEKKEKRKDNEKGISPSTNGRGSS